MFIGQLMKTVSQWSGIQYTSLLTVVGIFLGVYHDKLGKVGEGIKEWS